MSSPGASSFLVDFLVGGLSAGVAKLAGAPFNRAKLMLQAQGELTRQGWLGRPLGGMTGALSHVVRTEGPLGLFRGAWLDVLCYFPTQSLNFAFRPSLRSLTLKRETHGYGLWFACTSGAVDGVNRG